MKDSTLLKISIAISLFGILLILFLANNLKIQEYQINQITEEQLDTQIIIKGQLTSVKETPGLYILTIKDNSSSIQTIIFKDNPINFTKNSFLEIKGKVTKYKDNLQLEAKEVKIL